MSNQIISISINDKLLEEVDRLQSELGFSGRSELIRAGLKFLILDKKEKEKLSGKISGVLIVVHKEETEREVTSYKHEFNSVIKTHVHTNLESKCMDLFTVEGQAQDIIRLTESMQKIKKIDYVKLIVS
ncbi:MAG: CopG family ribbon-helix-helix protein [Candidatus Aenigmarchaeota archaeon]|nr:CopG family ribbon-helix-helix protein [Candidatus Aenigmarchaeota archaeon]